MADRWAVQDGNWSDTATWNGGTLPDVGDDVFADGKTVTIDIDIEVGTLRISQRSGGTAGGRFNATDGVTVTADILLNNSTVTNGTLEYTGAVGFNIVGNLFGTIQSSGRALIVNATNPNCEISVIGNIEGEDINSRISICDFIGSCKINIVGNLVSTRPSGVNSNSYAISCNNSVINILGDIILNPSATIAAASITHSVIDGLGNTVFIVGNLISNFPSFTFNGIIKPNNLFFTGNIFASSSMIYYTTSNSLVCDITGNVVMGTNRITPIFSPVLTYNVTPNTFWEFPDVNLQNNRLFSPDTVLDAPQASDVREGVDYAEGILTGTLKVPSPEDVRKNIPVDNTVGTAELTGEDIAESVLTAISNSSLPLAERLRNVSTVQSTGDQITSI